MKEDAKKNKKRQLIAASMAGLLAVTGVAALSGSAFAETEKCYGVAKKGMGECGGKGHGCAGQNETDGTGWLTVPTGLCEKIVGGSLTE
jgi:uncharacterized membrane protein